MSYQTEDVICQECHTPLGGNTGKDIFKHMLHCLKVEKDSLARIRQTADAARNENGRRIIHLINALESQGVSSD